MKNLLEITGTLMTYNINRQAHKVIFSPKRSKNYLATVVIGKKHFNDWKKFCLKSWLNYCKKNNLGLIVINKELINRSNKNWMKPTWQRLLIGGYIANSGLKIENVCALDSDIYINPLSPNIFNFFQEKKISVVNFYKNLPFLKSDYKIRERIVYLRRTYLNKFYPIRISIIFPISATSQNNSYP